jgi:hypothetical protein
MIVKSLARKSRSFGQLYDYITGKWEETHSLLWNLNQADPMDKKTILDAFYHNGRLLPERKNGNYLYHEIVSIPRVEYVALERQKSALYDTVVEYVKRRAKKLLVFGGLHVEGHHIHFHLMVSSNAFHDRRRFRLSRFEFSRIQKEVENHLLLTYPELQDKPRYNRENKEHSPSNAEYWRKRRSGQPTKKELLKGKLKKLFEAPLTQEEFAEVLKKEGLSLYQRGKNIVVTDGLVKHRLKTLGLEAKYRTMMQRALTLEELKHDMSVLREAQRSLDLEMDLPPDFPSFS